MREVLCQPDLPTACRADARSSLIAVWLVVLQAFLAGSRPRRRRCWRPMPFDAGAICHGAGRRPVRRPRHPKPSRSWHLCCALAARRRAPRAARTRRARDRAPPGRRRGRSRGRGFIDHRSRPRRRACRIIAGASKPRMNEPWPLRAGRVPAAFMLRAWRFELFRRQLVLGAAARHRCAFALASAHVTLESREAPGRRVLQGGDARAARLRRHRHHRAARPHSRRA